MRELAVRRFAEDGRSASQRFQQPPAQGPARPVVGIQHHLEPPAADSRHVHGGQNRVEVAGQRIGQRPAGSEAVVGRPGESAAAIAGQDLLAQAGGNDSPFGGKQLDSVIGRGVVAGGDLHCRRPRRIAAPTRRRWAWRMMPASRAVAAEGLDPRQNRRREHLARRAAVAADHDRPRRGHGGKRGDVANGRVRRQRLSDDAPQSGNADDRLGHGDVPWMSRCGWRPRAQSVQRKRDRTSIRGCFARNQWGGHRLTAANGSRRCPTYWRLQHQLSTMTPSMDIKTALAQLDAAAAEGKLSPAAAENIRTWLTEPLPGRIRPASGRAHCRRQVEGIGRRLLDDHPLRHRRPAGQDVPHRHQRHQRPHHRRECPGPGRLREGAGPRQAAFLRHRLRHAAPLAAVRRVVRGIMAAAGFQVYFLDGYRSTPELSFAVRYKRCDCGIMITASHNPPADNAVKVYWSTGGQLLPPHDEECIDCVQQVNADRADAVCRGACGRARSSIARRKSTRPSSRPC